MRPTVFLALFILCGSAVAGPFTTQRLSAGPGTIRAIRIRDLSGDGRPDLAVFTDGKEGIAILIWFAGADGALPKTPTTVIKPADHFLTAVDYACLAGLKKGAPASLVIVDREKGVLRFGPGGAGGRWVPEKLADAPPLPFPPDENGINVLDAAADIDGSGDEELLLPSTEGYRIVDGIGDPDGKLPLRIIDTGSTHYLTAGAHRFLTLHWEIPRLTVVEYDGDGIPDLIGRRGREFLLFLQRKNGTFMAEPRRLNLLQPGPGAKERSSFSIADVNGDGRVDLLVTQTPTGVKVMGDFSSQHSLFLNPRIFSPRTAGRLGTPASTFRTSGTSINPVLFDFDRDGDLDLVVSSLKIDLGSQIRKDVSADYRLFLFDAKEKKFDGSTHFDISRTYPWDRLQRNSTDPVCFFTGDFDGDGRPDLLDIADDGHLAILAGGPVSGLFSAKYGFSEGDEGPLFRAKATVESDVIIRDINGDDASDLVAYRKSHVYVIRSKR